ncbi:MAG: thioredoxin fold domain-containing protein [bacterium]|nr:thioredoxin fold domain-containing protein [bacterium]
MRLSLLSAIIFLLLSACGSEPHGEAPHGGDAVVDDGGHHDGIAWFDGEVDEAFALAKEENKPLFLYWGAIWCPPCHYLKTKIFTRPKFIEQSRAFVPVYLDGDTERAQILGERFGTQGYPTVILFNPAGVEITRMPSDLPVDRYGEVLGQAMSRMRPIKDILQDVRETGPAEADAIDLNLLAFYAWGQDHAVQLSTDEKVETFGTLYQQTPAERGDERSRFLSLYLKAQIRSARDDDAKRLAAEERTALDDAVLDLLGDPARRLLNLDLLLYWSRETVELLHAEPSPERSALVAAWDAAARAVEADESVTVDDRLSALFPRLWLTQLEAGTGSDHESRELPEELPEELRDHIRERIAWAGEAVTGESELQAVMSTMTALLQEAALTDEAEALLSERLADTVAPYYYMSWIASMKREAGQPEEALDWYRKAYDNATGRYTRFRWGSIYLRQLMKLAPGDVSTLEADSIAILDELLSLDDAFAGGNHSRLEQLDKAYQRWNEDGEHDALIAGIRDHVHAACDRYPEGDEDAQRSRCRSFLRADEAAAG